MKTSLLASAKGIFAVALLLLCFVHESPAGTYGEHKHIGDSAFAQVVRGFIDSVSGYSLLRPARTDSPREGNAVYYCSPSSESTTYWFVKLKREDGMPEYVTYGDLCALSGDHVENPLRLYEEIRTEFSALRGIILAQHKYLDRYFPGAPDVEIALQDASLLGMVIDDKSHFYDYWKSIKEHLNGFKIRYLDSLIAFSGEKFYTKELYNVTSLNKYITLHSFAIHTAQIAARTNNHDLLRLALFLNAYADHFINDAFSSGHRAVHRSYLGNFTNNKFMHDFFGSRGLAAINLNGQRWLSYGDGLCNKTVWNGFGAAGQVMSDNMRIAIQCCSTSVAEVTNAFITALNNSQQQTLLDTLRDRSISANTFYSYCLNRFRSLRFVPVPFEKNRLDETELALDSASAIAFEAKQLEPGFDSLAFSTYSDSQRLQYLDSRPYITGPADLVSTVKHHKGIAISGIFSKLGSSINDYRRPDFSIGYSVSYNGVANNFSYDNTTFQRPHFLNPDWWMDISFTNRFVRRDSLSGSEYKFGVNNCIDVNFIIPLEFGVLFEFGWYTLEETRFSWEASGEVGFWPHHNFGFTVRIGRLNAPGHYALDLGIVFNFNHLLDKFVGILDRIFLGLPVNEAVE